MLSLRHSPERRAAIEQGGRRPIRRAIIAALQLVAT